MIEIPDLENFTVYHTRFEHALDTLERKYHFHSPDHASTGITVTGPTGSGKTSLLNRFEKLHASERKFTVDGWIKPIINVTVPAFPTMKDFLITLFNAIGADPGRRMETIACKTERFTILVKRCQLKVIILEEFQHFLNSSDSRLGLTANLLKNLMNDTNILLILSGINVTNLLSYEKQLGRRSSARLELDRFDWNKPDEQKEFGIIILAFFNKIRSYGWTLPDVPDQELILRFYKATDGHICYIKAILKEAVQACGWSNRNVVTMFDLQDAWYNVIKSVFPDNQNPFEVEMDRANLIASTPPTVKKQRTRKVATA